MQSHFLQFSGQKPANVTNSDVTPLRRSRAARPATPALLRLPLLLLLLLLLPLLALFGRVHLSSLRQSTRGPNATSNKHKLDMCILCECMFLSGAAYSPDTSPKL